MRLPVKSRETVTCDGAFGEHLQEPDFVSMMSFRPLGSGLRLLPHSSWRTFDGGRTRIPIRRRSAGP